MEAATKSEYKMTEVGLIPSDWEVSKLADAVIFLDGQRRPIKSSEREKLNGEYPYYGASGIIDYVNDYIFDDELILLGEDGENILSRNLPLAFKVKGKIWVNNHAHVLKPIEHFDINFLTNYLESLDYSLINSGTAQPKLNKHACSNVQIIKPPLPEQTAIATALKDTDHLINTLENLIAKKKLIKQGAMQELLKPKEGWKLDYVKNLATIKTGSKNTQDKIDNGEYPFFVRSETIEKINSYSFDGEAILIAGDGVGTGKVVLYFNGKFDFHQRVYKISDFEGYIDGYYFYLYFKSNFLHRVMQMTAKSSVDSIRLEMIADMQIPFPPKDQQKKIANYLGDIDIEIEKLEQKLNKYLKIKVGMMQQLLTGKIRLV